MKHFQRALLCLFITLSAGRIGAHPMPNSVLLLDIKSDDVDAELQWPLKELQLVFPDEQIDTNVRTLLQRKGQWLDNYLRQHLVIKNEHGGRWTWTILSKSVTNAEQEATGVFHELIFHLQLQPPAGSSPRHFTVFYDAIMHQLVTHKMLVSIRQDWDGGQTAKDSKTAQLGLVMMDMRDNQVTPLTVSLDEGSKWKGFKSMAALGIAHISEGTDHLLFLLVLLLPAPLLSAGGRWGKSVGMRYSIIRLLKITTAFTFGHSLTLLLGAIGWVRLPSQPIEMLIAVSILIGAIHALRPIFPGKEALVAAGFGLVHGLAFAGTLVNLHLDGGRMALSILGFNIGIELMQLFVILITVPWLIILSDDGIYKWIRIVGGIVTAIAAVAWLIERAVQKSNPIAKQLDILTTHGNYFVMGLALIALGCYFMKRKSLGPQL